MHIHHDPLQRRFVWTQGQTEAFLQYRYLPVAGRCHIDFSHTFVPTELRGQGIAAALTQAALRWGRASGCPLQASCRYVAERFVK